ncbi:MAG: cysteine desulfurase [Rhodospirillaceae bacterium]|nr:cysteine desulfurase [Rhodospirillaceae bacterium]
MTRKVNTNRYLDYNASAPMRPIVMRAMQEAMHLVGNPSSVHKHGREVSKTLTEARDILMETIGAKNSRVIFTSGGTESNNLALHGRSIGTTMVSDIEHDSVLFAADDKNRIPVNSDGIVDLKRFEEMLSLRTSPTLISVMLANNETGVIQPLHEITSIAHHNGCLVHCDAVQALGKMDINMSHLGVDLLSLSAHKTGGPKGIGALIIADGVKLGPQLVGGGQEYTLRPGTENFVSISGFAATLADIQAQPEEISRISKMRSSLENKLRQAFPDVEIFGCNGPRLINTTCIRMRGLPAETQVIALDLAGISVSAGSACSSGKVTPSHVLKAMGLSSTIANEAIRISIGWATTDEDIESATKAWIALQEKALLGDFLGEHQDT